MDNFEKAIIQLPCQPDAFAFSVNILALTYRIKQISKLFIFLSDHDYFQLDHLHNETITCLKFYRQELMLCSASKDYIILWNIKEIIRIKDENKLLNLSDDSMLNSLISSHKIILNQDICTEISCIEFDNSGLLLAYSKNRDIEIISIKTKELFCNLEGHRGKITCMIFHPIKPHLLISTSEDKTFKIWDLLNKCLFYQSSVLCGVSLSAVCAHFSELFISIASSDGRIWFYEIFDNKNVREIYYLDMEKIISSNKMNEMNEKEDNNTPFVISSEFLWNSRYNNNNNNNKENENNEIEYSCNFVNFCFIPNDNNNQDRFCSDLYVITSTHFIQIEIPSFSSKIITSFNNNNNNNNKILSNIISFADIIYVSNYNIQIITCAVFEPKIFWFRLNTRLLNNIQLNNLNLTNEINIEQIQNEIELSLFPSINDNSIENSILSKCEMTDLPTALRYCGASRRFSYDNWEKPIKLKSSQINYQNTKKQSSSIIDQPVTFHSKIKSSGYGTINDKNNKKIIIKTNNKNNSNNKLIKDYPMNCGILQFQQSQNNHMLCNKTDSPPIISISYSNDAQYLACASMDNFVRVFRLPISKYNGECITLKGHDSKIFNVDISQDRKMLISSSADNTARLYLLSKSDNSLVFNNINKNNSKINKNENITTLNNNFEFRKEIKKAAFYYCDKFISLASGGFIYLYNYSMDAALDITNDLKRLQIGPGRYKLIDKWAHGNAQTVNTFDCINSAISHIIISGCSDKSIHFLDVASGRTSRVIENAHTRPIHTIALPKPSPYVALSLNEYNCFLSSATDGIIALWDIRANRCVSRFSGHLNRRETIGLAFSPCMRFIATGSEDRTCRIYDIRMVSECAKITGHLDAVSTVAFNPIYPQLVTGSYDGQLRFFTDN